MMRIRIIGWLEMWLRRHRLQATWIGDKGTMCWANGSFGLSRSYITPSPSHGARLFIPYVDR
jgi:hypothetical protein